MDGGKTNKSPQTVEHNIIQEMTIATPSISSLSLTTTRSMDNLDSSSTGTVVTVPTNAGALSFDPNMFQQVLDFMSTRKSDSPSLKRKRNTNEELSSNGNKSEPKSGKPNIPPQFETEY
jgi:hypothetical protein